MVSATTSARLLNHPRAGIAFVLMAVFILTGQDAIIKWLVRDYPLLQIMFIRSVFMIVPAFALLHAKGNLAALKTKRPGGHLLRLVFHFFGFLGFFFALSRMPLAETMALGMTAPLFITLFSGLLLGETVRWRRWLAIFAGFAGVLIIMQPGGGPLDTLGVGAVMIFAVCYALWTIQTRHLSSTETSDVIVFFGAAGFMIVTGFFMPFVWVEPTAFGLGLLMLLGLIATAGHYCLAQAYRHAPAHVIAPFEYTGLIWAIILGFIVFGDLPSAWMIPGAALVIGSGLYIFQREHRVDSHVNR
ncbi:MAG: DMT family transporter [Gammaproteobacteria bacterium]